MLKFLLIIPAIFLFLSNIPFIQRMDMEEMMSITPDEGCCMKKGNMEGICLRPPAEQEKSKNEDCRIPGGEKSCVCICCFQYAAPEQSIIKFSDKEIPLFTTYSGILAQHWADPFLSRPWQPPDFS